VHASTAAIAKAAQRATAIDPKPCKKRSPGTRLRYGHLDGRYKPDPLAYNRRNEGAKQPSPERFGRPS
jgi:hypothetical protein